MRRLLVAVSGLVLALGLMAISSAGERIYVQFAGIKGEVAERSHQGWVEALAFQQEIISPRDPQSGLPTGQRMHKPFTITRKIDSASPKLFQACAAGQHFPKVVIHFVRGESLVVREVTLDDVIISKVTHGGGAGAGGAAQTETLALEASKFSESYHGAAMPSPTDKPAPRVIAPGGNG